jgi:hypothetical protein
MQILSVARRLVLKYLLAVDEIRIRKGILGRHAVLLLATILITTVNTVVWRPIAFIVVRDICKSASARVKTIVLPSSVSLLVLGGVVTCRTLGDPVWQHPMDHWATHVAL